MCGKLDYYLDIFTRLKPNKNRQVWTKHTHYCSPYKPLLLLSVIDHIASGEITRNFVEPSFDLAQTFQRYILLLPSMKRKANIALPFYYLTSAGFWNLKPRKTEKNTATFRSPSSLGQFQRDYYGVELAEELFPLLQMPGYREKFQEILLTTYFSTEVQQAIREQSFVNYASAQYSFTLTGTPQHKPLSTNEPDTKQFDVEPNGQKTTKVRDQGFRRAIVKLYDHRCALCGIKMMTSGGHTVVDAAHIKPWAESHNDHPTNGMALCKLCHWSFDEGLMSIDALYQVSISPSVKKDPNLPGHILTLSDRPMFRPNESRFWPDQDCIKWHRKNVFEKRLV